MYISTSTRLIDGQVFTATSQQCSVVTGNELVNFAISNLSLLIYLARALPFDARDTHKLS